MINKKQFQISVLKEMLSDSCRFKRTQIDDGFLGITDGYYMIILHEQDLFIRLGSMREFQYDFSKAKEEHTDIKDTNIRRLENKYTIAKLESEDGKTVSYVKEEYLKKFCGCRFFSGGGNDPVYVKDEIGELVGVIMPIRISAKTFF